MQNRIKQISNFYTYLGQLQGGKPVAALILPSNLRSRKYPNSFRVDEVTGKLYIKGKASVVPNNTVKELTNIYFRMSCNKNKEFLDTLTFEQGMLWGFEYAFSEWVYYLPEEYTNITIYGGEILNSKMLKNICDVLRKNESKHMCIYTYNDEAVTYIRNAKLVPDNLKLYNSKEWLYLPTDTYTFDFCNVKNNKFIVPTKSSNFKYYHEAISNRCNKKDKKLIPQKGTTISIQIGDY